MATKSLDSIDPALLGHAREFIQKIVDREFNTSVNAAAETMRVSQSQLRGFLREENGLGPVVLERIATFKHMNVDDLLGRTPSELSRAQREGVKKRLRDILGRLGIDARELSLLACLDEPCVGDILKDGYADFVTLDAIARAAGVELVWLLTGNEPRPIGSPLPPRMVPALAMAKDEEIDPDFIVRWAKLQQFPDRPAHEWLGLLRLDHMRWIKKVGPARPSSRK